MSRSASPQFKQLPMFMTAREVQQDAHPADLNEPLGRSFGSREELWKAKLSEAERPNYVKHGEGWDPGDYRSLVDDIKAEGIKRPITVLNDHDGMTLLNGHHRVAVAASISPDYLLPVLHRSWDDR